MKDAILYQPWGGLGDNLQFSTLPELYYKQDINFYVSENNVYRNEEISKLVWETNPYFKGYTNATPNCGSIVGAYKNTCNNFIMNIEFMHELPPTNILPKLYYNHNNITYLNNKIILSLQAISDNDYDENLLLKSVVKYLENVNKDDILFLMFQKNTNKNITWNKYTRHYGKSLNYNIYEVKDIFEHADIIGSCYEYISVQTGGPVISSAMNKLRTTIFVDKDNLYNNLIPHHYWYFENIKYIPYNEV
jgi:hypothetical protein